MNWPAELESFVSSMRPYQDLDPNEFQNFMVLKHKELLLILLKVYPRLKDMLFDFSIPGKIDLESFMNLNFRYNVKMERFAYLCIFRAILHHRSEAKYTTIPRHTTPLIWFRDLMIPGQSTPLFRIVKV